MSEFTPPLIVPTTVFGEKLDPTQIRLLIEMGYIESPSAETEADLLAELGVQTLEGEQTTEVQIQQALKDGPREQGVLITQPDLYLFPEIEQPQVKGEGLGDGILTAKGNKDLLATLKEQFTDQVWTAQANP